MFGQQKWAPAGLAGLLALAAAGPAAGQGYLDAVGFNALKARLGGSPPTGAGVPVALIEAGTTNYLPDRAAFPDSITITARSGAGGVSNHATSVGQHFFGPGTLATGITEVDAYKVNGSFVSGDWLGDAYLRFGMPESPLVEPHRVQNHSYISDAPAPAGDLETTELLRRYDLAIRRDNIVATVGVANSPGAVPDVQASGYNSIAVGLTGGGSSIGPTTFAEAGGVGPGRSKPDIVAPLGVTSHATPVVGAAAALLIETAAGKADPGERGRAGRTETIKAALLSGATKAEFAGLAQPWRRVDNGTFVEPLDRRFGAGELNIDRSHRILDAPEQFGTDRVFDAPIGWDYESFDTLANSRRYLIDVPADLVAAELTATATWLRRVTRDGTTFTATLSRVELRLYESDTAGNLGTPVDASLSPIDNVQHLYADLVPGRRYAIEVTAAFPVGQSEEDVAVAWFAAFTPVPEPIGVLVVGLAVAAVAVRRNGGRARVPGGPPTV